MDNNNFMDEGVTVPVGFSATVTFYPLSWATMRKMRKQWDTIFSQKVAVGSEEWHDALGDLLYASVARQGTLTKEAFLEMLDMRNMKACFQALLEVNGMKPKKDVAAEGTEPRPTSPLIGDTSTTR